MPTMPNVVGEEYQEALQAFEAAGVMVQNRWSIFAVTTVSVRWVPSSERSGTVLAQVPAPGAEVAENSSVELTVSEFATGVVYP